MPRPIPLTQQAVVFNEHKGPLFVKNDWPVVQPKDLLPGQALVNIKYSGVCHTDLHALSGDWPAESKLPLVGGHEGSGYIVAIGDHTQTKLKVGQAVGIKWLADACLDCEMCRSGEEPLCPDAQNSGYSVDGTFQQYAVAFTRALTPLPAGLDLASAAPILCAGVTVYKAIKNSNTKPSDYILISGAGGGLGHLAIQYANTLGLRVLAVDTGDAKRELCMKLGADSFIDFKQEGFVEKVKEAAGGLGPHAAIIASANPESYNEALEYLRPHGTLVAVGLPDAFIQANVFKTVMKSLRIVGSYVGNRQDAIEALDLAAAGKIKALIELQPLAKLEEVYARMEKGQVAGRIVLKCDEDNV